MPSHVDAKNSKKESLNPRLPAFSPEKNDTVSTKSSKKQRSSISTDDANLDDDLVEVADDGVAETNNDDKLLDDDVAIDDDLIGLDGGKSKRSKKGNISTEDDDSKVNTKGTKGLR